MPSGKRGKRRNNDRRAVHNEMLRTALFLVALRTTPSRQNRHKSKNGSSLGRLVDDNRLELLTSRTSSGCSTS